MDITTSLLVTVGVFNALLGAVILFHGPRKKQDLMYALVVAALVFWTAAIIAIRLSGSLAAARFALSSSYFAGVAIAFSFWIFVMFFTGRKIGRIRFWILSCFAAAIVFLAYTSPDFIRDIAGIGTKYKEIYLGPFYILFVLFFGAVMTDAFFKLFGQYSDAANSGVRLQLAYIFGGTLVTTVVGSAFNIFLVAFGNSRYIGFGPLATCIMVGAIGYAIARHNFLNIRVIGAEFFTLLLFVILAIQFIFSSGLTEAMLNGAILLLAVGFGILLIKSVLREVKDKEMIAALAAELSASNEELKKLDQAKSEFISLASHQLRTPLTVIRGYLSMILEGSFGAIGDKLKEPLTNTMSSAGQLIRLVNDLLDLSRIESGRIQYRMETLQIGDLVEKVALAMKDAARDKGIEIAIVSSIREFRYVSADSDKLSSAIMNIIDNAIKHSHGSRIEITLKEGASENNAFAVISVRDDGVGISPEDISKLFVKFSHAGKESGHTHGAGLGIGLYFAKRVVEDHRGRIWAESPGAGRGSIFYIELPAEARKAAAVAIAPVVAAPADSRPESQAG